MELQALFDAWVKTKKALESREAMLQSAQAGVAAAREREREAWEKLVAGAGFSHSLGQP